MDRRHFLVVFCSNSAVRFQPNEQFNIKYSFPSGDTAFLAFHTRWLDEGFDATVPRWLCVEAQGTAESLDSAISTFRSAADHIGSLLSIATNAGRDPFDVEVALDVTPGCERHEYFQNFVRQDRWFPVIGRRPDVDAVHAFISTFDTHPRRDRLQRAIAQYVHALSVWTPGAEAEAVSHLWMGVDAITPVVIDAEIARTGVANEQELATAIYGLQPSERGYVDSRDVAGYVRRMIVFQGDDRTHRLSKAASDGFEHGFADLSLVHRNSREVKERLAKYLRSIILTMSCSTDGNIEALQNERFESPLAAHGHVWYLRGHLLGPGENLINFERLPIMQWRVNMKAVVAGDEPDARSIHFDQSITPILPDGVSFEPGSIEVWDTGGRQEHVSKDDEVST